jgi:hypothetical protein
MELEADIEKQVVRWVEDELGGECLKLKDEERGFPDRTLLLPGGLIVFVELKRPKKNKRYHMQELWIARLKELGFRAAFCYSLDEVKELANGLPQNSR